MIDASDDTSCDTSRHVALAGSDDEMSEGGGKGSAIEAVPPIELGDSDEEDESPPPPLPSTEPPQEEGTWRKGCCFFRLISSRVDCRAHMNSSNLAILSR